MKTPQFALLEKSLVHPAKMTLNILSVLKSNKHKKGKTNQLKKERIL